MIYLFRLIIFLFFFSEGLYANSTYTLKKGFSEFSSPIIDQKTIFWTGMGVSVASFLLFKDQIKEFQKNIAQDRPLGEFSKYGDYFGRFYPNLAYALGAFIYGKTQNSEYLKKSEDMLKASLYSVSLTTLLKHSIREKRPDPSVNRLSFPSGHTTSAFAFASTIALNHRWYWGALSYGLAGLTAGNRLNDNRHYLHDIIAGATVGIAYGYSVKRARRKGVKLSSQKLKIIPLVSSNEFGVDVSVRLD